MRAIQFRNIKREKQICCKCGGRINAQGRQLVMSIERGKYLCVFCETQITKERKMAK